MDAFILLGLLAVVLVGVPLGLVYLCYLLPKKLGYPKAGKYISIGLGLCVVSVVLLAALKDQLFTNSDARALVEEQGIFLSEHFVLKHNESMSAIGDYYHTFTLEISAKDKARAIEEIKRSANFKHSGIPVEDLLSSAADRYKGPRRTQNYETETAYVREYFAPNGEGYAPTFRRILIDKKENRLSFEDIDN